jgi:fructokinase
VNLRIGVDVGGTKIEGVALDGSRELARVRIATPRDDYGRTLDAVADVVGEVEQRAMHGRAAVPAALRAIGVGIPGAVSRSSGLVKNANSVWLNGRPLPSDLAARLGRRVRVANDANCFAISEAVDGAAAGAAVVFGVIVGTGTGAGIVVNGALLAGVNGIAGEWGHNPLPWPEEADGRGRRCYCGKDGCIETYLSGPGMSADHAQHCGEVLTAAEIASRAETGDRHSLATLDRYERRMARALAGIINVLDPDVIVLGGGMSNIARLYERVPALWDEWVFAAGVQETVSTRLRRAVHGDSSGVRGAARLWR